MRQRLPSATPWLLAFLGLGLVFIGLTLCAALILLFGFRPFAMLNQPQTITETSPSIMLRPNSGPLGQSFTVRGQGWGADRTIVLGLNREPDILQAIATTDESGRFEQAFNLPQRDWIQTGTSIFIFARDTQSGQTALAQYNIIRLGDDTPTPLPTPTPNAPNATAIPLASPTLTAPDTPASPSPTATETATPAPSETPTPTSTATPSPTLSPTPTPSPTATPTPAIQNWRGEYYDNPTLSGSPRFVRDDAILDFDWGSNVPIIGMPADNFSVRWTRTLRFSQGEYRFRVEIDDGVRLWLNNILIINDWRDGGERDLVTERDLSAGSYRLELEYYERSGNARIGLGWEQLSDAPTARITAPSRAQVGKPVIFSGRQSSDDEGRIEDYLWDFGDGVTNRGEEIAHTYRSTGVYNVTLIVTDPSGRSDRTTRQITIDTNDSGTPGAEPTPVPINGAF